MHSSYRIFKNHELKERAGVCPIPVETAPAAAREHTSAGQAESLIRQARQRADELVVLAERERREVLSKALSEAAEAVEAEKEKGYQAGFESGAEEGYAEGYAEGRREGLERSEAVVEEGRKALAAAHEASRAYIGNTQREIIELSVRIAETIVQKELQLDDSIIVGVAKAALADVRSRSQIVVRAGRREILVLQDRLEELRELCPNGVFTLLRDGTVAPGGCVIETDVNTLDATVDKRLENIRKVLEEAGVAHDG